MLEDLALAEGRGALILGEVAGYGFSSDGAHLSVPDGHGLARAMRRALAEAGIKAEEVDLLLAHATSTPAGDAAEAENIRQVFAGTRPWVGALKAMTGHELWMAGAATAVYAVLMARGAFMAPTINFARTRCASPSPPPVPAAFAGSLGQVLDELRINGRLRSLLEVHCLLHGALPGEIPFALHAGVVGGYYGAAHSFKGGGRRLAQAFVAALRGCGVELFCRHQVSAIKLSPAGALTGVRCANGVELDAAGVIATLHPRALLPLLPAAAWRPAYRKRLLQLRESVGAEIVFLHPSPAKATARAEKNLSGATVSGFRSGLPGRNYFFLPESGGKLFDFTLPPGRRLLYLNLMASEIAGTGLRGGITAVLPTLPGSAGSEAESQTAYAARKERLGEAVRERLLQLLPELGSGLRVACVATNRTLRRINASATGSLYGVRHQVGQYNPAARTRLAGLLLAGQATAAPGLLGALISAFPAVGEVVGQARLREWRERMVCDG